jgi:phage-related tail protein
MTSTKRLNLARNVQAHIRALQAAINRLTELRAHYELTAISRALARLTSQFSDQKKLETVHDYPSTQRNRMSAAESRRS